MKYENREKNSFTHNFSQPITKSRHIYHYKPKIENEIETKRAITSFKMENFPQTHLQSSTACPKSDHSPLIPIAKK